MTISPLDAKHFTPNLEPLPPRQVNWIGRVVHWVHAADNYNVIYRSSIVAFAIFASIAMIVSVVGIPLFILCYKEFIRQEQRLIYDAQFKKFMKQATDQNRHWYLQGLWGPINESGKITITPQLREKLVHELQIPPGEASGKSDIQLLKEAACLHPDWVTEYNLRVVPNS